MRAYMSDRRDDSRTIHAAVHNLTLAADALAECRAILADTEPIREGYSLADRLYRGPFLMVEPFDAERALAESLRAFIAE
jgi:hypothetical protein